MRPLFAPAILVLAALAFAAPARALTPADQSAVAQAESYFDRVHTLKAAFQQDSDSGDEQKGTIYLERPGKLRLEYAPPSPVLIVAEEGQLVYYDSHLQQVSYVDLDSTMAGVLVAEHVALDGKDLKVQGVAREPGLVKITVARRADPKQGRIVLAFTEKPFELRQWTVTDAQGSVTTVTLYDAQTGLALDPKLFEFHDPRPFPKPAR